MSTDADKKADYALYSALLPISMVVISKIVLGTVGGWEAIAYHYMILFAAGFVALVPMTLGIVAIARKTKRTVRAKVAIVVPPVVIALAMVLLF